VFYLIRFFVIFIKTKRIFMTVKEILLITVVLISVMLYFKTIIRLNEMDLDKNQKNHYRFISILIPIAGYILVKRKKRHLNK